MLRASTLLRQVSRRCLSVPASADVVVVGGGVAGCSLLYHLSRLGVSNAVLVEKDAITAGSTWHAAGIVWNMRANDVETELFSRTWKLLGRLEEEEEVSVNLQPNGSLMLADSPLRMQEFTRLSQVGRWTGVENHYLTPAEAKQLHPFLNTEHIYAAYHIPSDGGLDQNAYCHALLKGATRRGAKHVTGVRVTGIETAQDVLGHRQVTGVVTSHGRIATNLVVNCCGAWAPALGTLAGVNVPLSAMRHAYVISDTIEGFRTLPYIRHNGLRLYVRTQGDSCLFGGYEWNPGLAEVEPDFAFSLYEMDWDRFSSLFEGAMKLLPVLETTGIKSSVCGPESFTPDHKPLLGEVPELRGFFLNCGFNSLGIMKSGGIGSEMAKWLVKGRPDLDLYIYNVRRFSNLATANQRWVTERSHESYSKNYSVHYPHDESVAARNIVTDALYEELLQRGAFYQQRHAIERPAWFDPSTPGVTPLPYLLHDDGARLEQEQNDPYLARLECELTYDVPSHHWSVIGRECHGCRNQVAVFNQSSFGKLYLSGPDAQAAADWIFSARVDRPVGSTIYTCALNADGGIEADLTVSVLSPNGNGLPHSPQLHSHDGPAFYLTTGSTARQYVESHIRDELSRRGFRCSLVDCTQSMVLLSVQGPYSRRLLQALTNSDLSDAAFPFSTHQEVEIAGHACRAMRLTFVGELGWELHVPNESAIHVYRALIDEGQQYGIVDAGFRAMDSLSVEKGYRHWQGDIRTDDNPLEAGLGFTCKLNSDHDFLGRTALQRQREVGVGRRLVLFALDHQEEQPIILHGQELVFRNGEIVSYLRRAAYAYNVGKSLGYGYLSTDLVKEGVSHSEWQVERFGERYPVTAHLRPLFDPKGLRIKGLYEDNSDSCVRVL